MAKACKVVGCVGYEDKDRKTGLCEEHSVEWMRSVEFKESTRDDDVRAYIALGLQTRAMMTINRKYKTRWLRRLAEEANT
jgi:hypothetical protein